MTLRVTLILALLATAALSAMAGSAASAHSLAGAAPALLAQGLVVQEAMPQICPGAEVPDLARHGG